MQAAARSGRAARAIVASTLGVVVALMSVGGCSMDKPKPPKDPARPFEYKVWFDSDRVAPSTVLTMNGEEVGRVTRYRIRDNPLDERSFGTLTLPMNWREQGEARFALRVETPCGVVELPLEHTREPTSTFGFKTPDPEDLPHVTHVYHDWGRGVRIGALELTVQQRRGWPAAGLDCGGVHEVHVDGESKGTLSFDEAPEHLFLPPDPASCYAFTSATYSKTGGSSHATPLRGSSSYVLPDKVDRFLEDPVDGVNVDKITAQVGMVLRFVHQVPCEEPEEAP
ncbi:MAG: hypothetical protein EA397_17230 [Deltaproteobacteria bacterium]|nr:MAG: hypothetical protein EA397_17230 [Deltaproteobacteria bacterium]